MRARYAPPTRKARIWSVEWFYFILVMCGWCFTPLLRRLIDWHNGFYNPIQLTSTLPFVLTLPLAIVAFRRRRMVRLSPTFRMFMWTWVGVFAYGFIVAVIQGNAFAAVYAATQYVVPLIVGLWIAGLELETAVIFRRLTIIMLTLGGIVAVYGLAQFADPQPWDVLWLVGGRFFSMGSPTPFGMHIWSTLNSSGPAADFFALTVLLTLPFLRLKTWWVWPFSTLVGAALMLTLVREAWIGLVVGSLVYIYASPRRAQTIPFLAIYAVLLALLVGVLPALLGAGGKSTDVISDRLSTLGAVNDDPSAIARQGEIQESFLQGISNPLGDGIGTIGASSALSTGSTQSVHGNNLDSGYLSRFLELGWFGFIGYCFVLFGGVIAMLRSTGTRRRGEPVPPDRRILIATAAAVCSALIWSDAAGDSHLGLDGVIFWIGMAIGLRPLVPYVERVPQIRRVMMRANRETASVR